MTALKKTFFGLLGLLVTVSVISLVGQKVDVLFGALTPPVLPELPLLESQPLSDQNWSEATSETFHYKTQGSRTLNIPLAWFMALEAPTNNPLYALVSKEEKFSSPDYLSGFGFVPQEASTVNPHGLPIGFAETPYQSLPGLDGSFTAIGFTCAACHTGQLVHDNKRYLFDGGPATVDLGQLTKSLGAALGQTAITSQLPFLNGRFKRFADAVLGEEADAQSISNLKSDLSNVVATLAKQPMGITITEGFGRLDALNRIGNQVFSTDPERLENYANIRAPVNFPPIWTSSWYSWVQYDGSIMSPLVRNMGEAMGTAGHMNFSAPVDQGRFSSTIPISNLHWIESNLAGSDAPGKAKAFNGLRAPSWPEAFPAIDQARAKKGEALYQELCHGCHLPALTKAVERGEDPDSEFWSHFKPIQWWDGDKQLSTNNSFLDINIIPHHEMGTDPAQGQVLTERTVNTAATASQPAMEINTRLCTVAANGLAMVDIKDDPMQSYALALGGAVQLGIQNWEQDHFVRTSEAKTLNGEQPNCLQAGQGYKARTLNGIWATGPFLHNGSVPTLEHLLGPVENRPTAFLLGDPTFDPVKVGIQVTEVSETNAQYSTDGYFILQTNLPGNSNRGHEFSDTKGPGVIGRGLNADERAELIEYLKTL